MPELGPLLQIVQQAGAVAVLVLLVVLLVREIVVPKGRLDDQKALTRDALDGWKGQTDATNRMAAALEERNKLDREHLDRSR